MPELMYWILSADSLKDLAATVLAYCISFLFIGSIWYQHLTLFSLLKDYDKGLVVRNLLLLFFIGLFPFCASLITKANWNMIPLFIYSSMVLLSIIAQYILHDYILIKRPNLRVKANIEKHLRDLHLKKLTVIYFLTIFVLVIVTYLLISNPEKKILSVMWMLLLPVMQNVIKRRKK